MKKIHDHLDKYIDQMKLLENKYLGFPNNMKYDYEFITKACGIYINNAGDPFSTLSWKKHSKHFEQEVVHFFLELYHMTKKDGWGYITSGGTEGNMEGMFLARESLPKATLYFSEDTHYSIAKAAKILRMNYVEIKSQESGEMNYEHFNRVLRKNKSGEAIVLVNCGTTVKGAFDNLDKIKFVLNTNKIKKTYIHVDGALSGMITPFIESAPFYSFDKGVDSIAISMHKFLGVPLMSGIVLARKHHVEKVKNKVEYINSHDTTISGSRNGHSPLYAWYAIKKYGKDKLKADAKLCLENAQYLHSKFQDAGFQSNLNQFSNTVYFD
ncbi:MAG: histidine decarboxylase [Candidatus Roizmanbacteria bacterium]|nr:histidine decarboxylase [Candidatus Roizmanbacteria bacterium]